MFRRTMNEEYTGDFKKFWSKLKEIVQKKEILKVGKESRKQVRS